MKTILSPKNSIPELLSPAGSPDAFYAALGAGADAVYLGGGDFNARIGAKNFSPAELEKAIYTAHSLKKKVYITLNTLTGDLEIPKAAEFAYKLHTMGADAFIVQDMGLGAYLKECIPDIVLHASTQMALQNADGAKIIEKYGFSRMVICREASKSDLELLIKNSPIEIEMFVHGAICVCRSGQCLMSSFIGKRSGNRGECAQPCRLNYNGAKPLLSIPDMCLAGHIKEIINLGAASLKIEGRMKSPEYVYGVTSIYRRLLDEKRDATNDEITALKNLFSRGFTDGYFTAEGVRGGAVRGERDKALSARAEREIMPSLKRAVEPVKAVKMPQSPDEIPEFIPPRAPKSARSMKKIKKTASMGLRIVFSEGARYSEKLLDTICALDFKDKYIEGIYFPLNSALPGPKDLYGVITPYAVMDTAKSKFDALLQKSTTLGYKKCLVRNVSHILSVENADYSLHGAMELNVYNSESVKFLREYGFASATLSPECLSAQIRDIDKYKIPCGVVVYGRLPLMVSEVCMINSSQGKAPCLKCADGCNKKSFLTDRTGASFPVYADGMGQNIIYNSLPLCCGDKLKILAEYGVSFGTLIFTDESEREIINIIKCFIKGENPDIPFTRGYLK